jgi:hypothetical protein
MDARRRARRIAAALLVAAAPAACAARGSTKGSDAMLGTLMKIIGESNAVAFVRLGPPAKAVLQGRPYVKVGAEVIENLRGLKPGAGRIDLMVPETQAAGLGEPGREAVVFLRTEGAAYRLTKFSEPLDVPADGREPFLKLVRDAVAAAQPMAGGAARRQHVLNALQSGFEVLQQDASRTALDMKGFTEPEIEALVALVQGDERRPPVKGLTRDNLLAAIFRLAAPARASSFGRRMLEEGAHREIYLGLAERDPKEAEGIVKGFLDDPDEKVRLAGLLVAGLLRRTDLLDAYEARYPEGQAPPPVRSALEKAREFAAREI